MGWADIAAGVSGALRGGLDAYSWQQDQQRQEQRDQRDAETDDLRRQQLRLEIEGMLKSLSAEPQDPVERIDTVDEEGHPVTRMLPRSQTIGQTFRKYVAPDTPDADPVIGVETVDEQGRPVTRYLPRSQASGQSFPKYMRPDTPVTPRQDRDPLVRVEVPDGRGGVLQRWIRESELEGMAVPKPGPAPQTDPLTGAAGEGGGSGTGVPDFFADDPELAPRRSPFYGQDRALPELRPKSQRGALPITSRATPQPAAAPTARTPAPAARQTATGPNGRTVRVGQRMRTKEGREVVIVGINPDGTVEVR